MRICVFGAGAVGGHFAARLAAAGHDVSVVARGAHLEAMRRNGVNLLHGDEVIRGRVRTADPGPQDAVLVTLKANMLGSFAEAAAEFYRAGLWNHLSDEDLIVIESPEPPDRYPSRRPRVHP